MPYQAEVTDEGGAEGAGMSGFVQLFPILERQTTSCFSSAQDARCSMAFASIRLRSTRAGDWNGDVDKPTLSPSILVTFNWSEQREERRCHSFVRDRRIEFLNDCTHALAGQAVDLPEIGDY